MSDVTLYDGPIVDAHHHFWDPTVNHHPWLTEDGTIAFRYGDYASIRRPYLPADYRADSAGFDIVQSVYVETEWDPSDPIGETRYIHGVAREAGRPNAVVAQAWLDRADAADVLRQQAEFSLVRSVRHKPGGPTNPDQVGTCRSLMSDDHWRQGFARLAGHGLRFDLQTAWWNLPEAILLARDFPGTTIILNHCGLPSDRSAVGLAGWHHAMGLLADCPNVVVKISGLGQAGLPWTVEANGWIIRETIAMFGADRTMFASNFPVDSLCASFRTIYSCFRGIVADIPQEDQRKLFYDTARRVYELTARDKFQDSEKKILNRNRSP